MIRRPLAALVTLLLLSLLTAACANTEQVGSKDNLNFEEQQANRLGEGSSTTEAPATTAAPTTAPPARAAPTTAKPSTTQPPRQAAPSFTIEIVASGQGYDPFAFSVKQGTKLVVVNKDSAARTFTSDEKGAFDSGPIPPGGSFSYIADKLGKFNFHDETRPFAVGQMEVTP